MDSPRNCPPPVERFQRIMARLSRARKPVPAATLAAELGVDYKTIDRDLAFMRERLGLPIIATRAGQWLNEKLELCPRCAGKVR